MLNRILQTGDRDVAATLIRVALGIVMLPHGAQKLLGMFGGHGYSATMGFFTEQLGIPAVFAFLAIVAESFGALGLITGVFTRIAALGVGSVMIVAMFHHLEHGFFMNWFGNQSGEGIEYHVLAIALALAAIIRGGGALSGDGFLVRRLKGDN